MTVASLRRKLAKFAPVPAGDHCLPMSRSQALFRGAGWTEVEMDHCRTCDWCWYFVTHDEVECLTARQLLSLSLGRTPTDEEWDHLAACPACAHDYSEVKK
jgi:hypothetical protein